MTTLRSLAVYFCAIFTLGAGCLSGSAAPQDAPASFTVGEFTFQRPKAWEWIKPGMMRKAELAVPHKDGKAEVVFFHFGSGQGGGTQANVDRWLGQFQEPRDKISAKTEEATVGRHKVTFVRAHGTYMSGAPGGPKTPLKDHALRGAILESVEGNVFVRMTGPISVIAAAEEEFRKLIESVAK